MRLDITDTVSCRKVVLLVRYEALWPKWYADLAKTNARARPEEFNSCMGWAAITLWIEH
jgi:hypothetical protein